MRGRAGAKDRPQLTRDAEPFLASNCSPILDIRAHMNPRTRHFRCPVVSCTVDAPGTLNIEECPLCLQPLSGCGEGGPSILAEPFVSDHVRWLDEVVA